MKLHPVDARWNGRREELMNMIHAVISNLKIMYGSLNNSIFLHMGDALMNVKELPLTGNDRRLLKKIWKEWHDYEANLRFGDINYFDARELGSNSKEWVKEGLTDAEFFDFWTAQGAKPYQMTLPLVGCLANKYRIILDHAGVKNSKNKASMMAVLSLFQTAVEIHEQSIAIAARHLGVIHRDIERALSPFSLRRVHDAWWHAMRSVIPELRNIQPDEHDQKNVDMTLRQLTEVMTSTDFQFGGLLNATEDYEELFRGDGMQKMIKDINDVKQYFESF